MDAKPLLDEFVATASQDAFALIVERYIGVVYAAARRQVHDQHLAQDVTQEVFSLLARKARSIPRNRPLSAWLLKTTRFVAANAWRQEQRRRINERSAATMTPTTSTEDLRSAESEQVAALLDEGMAQLNRADRDALLLKFFEGSSLRDIGGALSISEDAAQKRVARAVDQLRGFFHRRGVSVSSAALGGFLAHGATEAAPAGLASVVSAKAATAGGGAFSLAKGVILMTAIQKLQTAAVAAVLMILAIGAVVVLKPRSDVAPSSQPPAEKSAGSEEIDNKWAVAFSDGTRVNLLGMRDEPSSDNRWWGPSGEEVAAPEPLTNPRMSVSGTDTRNIRLDLVITGPSVFDNHVEVEMAPSMSAVTSTAFERDGSVKTLLIAVPRATDSATLRLGLASGPWSEVVIYDPQRILEGDQSAWPRVASVIEENGQTLVRVLDSRSTPPQQQEGVFVFANGKLRSWSRISGGDSGNVYTYDCRKDEVEQVLYRWRPYEFVELQNVSLRPTTRPTNVQVRAENVPTPEPAAADVAR